MRPTTFPRSLLIAAGLMASILAPAAAFAEGSPVQQFEVEVPADARGEGAIDKIETEEGGETENPRVESSLIVDATQAAPGDAIRAGVLFTMDPSWHIYWRNSGDAGMSTALDVTATLTNGDSEKSTELEVGPLQWPAPNVFERPGGNIITFGYGGQVLLFRSIQIPDSASPGDRITIRATPDYLACDVQCIPGSSTLTHSIDVADSTKRHDGATGIALAFDRATTKIPRTPEQLGIDVEVAYSQTPIRPGDSIDAAIGLDNCPEGPDACETWSVISEHDKFAFIPDSTSQVDWTTTGIADHPNSKRGSVIRLQGKANPNDPEDNERFAGIIHLENDAGASRAIVIDKPLPRGSSDAEVTTHDNPLLSVELPNDTTGGAPTAPDANSATASNPTDAPASPPNPLGLWQALLFAFLGGAILNLMPCVFPVLALKVSSFTKLVHEDRSHILAHGAAYTAGIVGSMLALAGVVLGLRAAGTQVGWGFQFQNPLFPAVLTGVLVLFAMNLFGVFEVNVRANEFAKSTKQASGLPRSAGEGVLAVVLATPCSAPFLGTAVGFALAAGPLTIVGIFSMLGLGLAAPFVLLTLVPGWARILPDPGEWMMVFKQLLGFALLGTGIWLVWVVGRTEGVDGMLYVLMFAGFIAIAAWLFGWMQSARSRSLPWLGALGAAAIIAGGGYWTLDFSETDAPVVADSSTTSQTASDSPSGIAWKKWTREHVDEVLKQGKPVFVDFTADWCITCKVNERTVLSTKKVRNTLDQCGFTSFKADWTDGSERIRTKLAEHGKGGVPMYLVYSPQHPENPQVLPELLTTDIVVSALKKAGPNKAGCGA